MALTTWEAAAARLGEKISAEDLDAKLDRLIQAARGMWNHYINLTIARDSIVTGQPVDQDKLDALHLVMQTRDAELYAIESQIRATDLQILKLPPDTDPVIVASSIRAVGKRKRLRGGAAIMNRRQPRPTLPFRPRDRASVADMIASDVTRKISPFSMDNRMGWGRTKEQRRNDRAARERRKR